jgi:hypothetical protein
MPLFKWRPKQTKSATKQRVAGSSGFGAPFHIVFTRHPLPDAGALQYSYDTLCLPKYSPIGNGVPPGFRGVGKRGSIGARGAGYWSNPPGALQPLQGANLTAIGSPGVLTGGFYAQPLVDITSPAPNAAAQAYVGITANPGQYLLPG